jgi:ribosome-binding protein aMBF1 (putative translation factor)
MEFQDWTNVKWTKKPVTNVNVAKVKGLPVKTKQKIRATNKGNIRGSQDGQKLAKISRTEIGTHEKVSKETANAIIKGRTQKNMSRKEFALAISEKLEVISSYENKSAIPNSYIITKMENILGLHLVGGNIGAIKGKKNRFAK